MKPVFNPRYWLFRFGFFSSLALFVVFSIAISPFISTTRRINIMTRWNVLITNYWLPLSAGIKIESHGLDNLTKAPCIVVSNHQSEWETLYLCGLLSPIAIVIKKSLLRLPLFGTALKMVVPIAIDRASPLDSIKQIIKLGSLCIAQGRSVLIFPEGTRNPPDKIKTYNRTASKLAIETSTPIVPIVHNASSCWSTGKLFQAGTIQLKIGEPIYPEGHTPSSLTKMLQQWTEQEYAEINQYQPN